MNIIKNDKLISAYERALEISNLRNVVSNKQKIDAYINSKKSKYLTILDEGSERAYARGGYTGVTIEYLAKFVCNTECFREVAIALVKLLDHEIINSIHCGHINNVVFESFAMGHDNYVNYVNCDEYNNNYNADIDEELILYLR